MRGKCCTTCTGLSGGQKPVLFFSFPLITFGVYFWNMCSPIHVTEILKKKKKNYKYDMTDSEPSFCLYITSGFLILLPNQRRYQPVCVHVNMYTNAATQCDHNPIKSTTIWQTLAENTEVPLTYTHITHGCGCTHSFVCKTATFWV